jgi:hypothetical protein
MAHEFGPATRGAHRALFEMLEKALAHLEISGDMLDRLATPGTVSAYKSDLRRLCDQCEAHLADASMREHVKKNRGKGGGFFSMSRIAESSAGPGCSTSRTPVLVLSRAEGNARVLEMERYNAARMNGRPADHPVASGGGRLLAAMTRDLNPAAPAASNLGLNILKKAMA